MANNENTRGGSSEQHAKAGSQSHKGSGSGAGQKGGSSEQHAKAGSQSHKNSGGSDKDSESSSGRGGNK